MRFEVYDKLPKEAVKIRHEVFEIEQEFKEEFDAVDDYATHITAFENDVPIAVCRIFQKENKWYFGRLAVIKSFRGRGIGGVMLDKAEKFVDDMGGKEIYLHAQCVAEEFYKKYGYTSFGDIENEEHVPHIWMVKKWR
jgi:predicted GNAT family N-acyltransferase